MQILLEHGADEALQDDDEDLRAVDLAQRVDLARPTISEYEEEFDDAGSMIDVSACSSEDNH